MKKQSWKGSTMEKEMLKNHAKQVIAGHQTDERASAINNKALAGAAGIAMAFDVMMMIYHLAQGNVNATLPWILQLVIMGIFVSLYKTRKKDFQIPVTFSGRTVRTGQDKGSRRNRIQYYLVDTAGFVVVFSLFDFFFSGRKPWNEYLIMVGLLFAMSFLLTYFTVEQRVRKHNQYLAELEAEDTWL
jgi:hypothetical protein